MFASNCKSRTNEECLDVLTSRANFCLGRIGIAEIKLIFYLLNLKISKYKSIYLRKAILKIKTGLQKIVQVRSIR